MIVVLVVLGSAALLSWLLITLLGAGQVTSDEKAREQAAAQADALLDEQFAGDPHVTAKVTPRTLPFEAVVIGAQARGYDLTAQSAVDDEQTLVFTKRA
ncbi:hypothetical protein [Cellulomonas rhizosphaerae]|uniref:Uncharacterized protein n=1 Tax=Cellulomonas rhizosphaerae TaxID=2293719 RepID=A0A413RJI3_9CELL|nr:hypothetical protein [Cellulomonas rhizosphaerae]RHA38743.1 hypothetical protein D1825_13500 [Cellulomonas rhizosphaerae]